MNVLAELNAGDTDGLLTLLVALLGVVGVGVGIYLAYVHNYVGAVIAAVIGVVLLFVALG